MPAFQNGQGIRERGCHDAASRISRSAKDQSDALNRDRWQRQRSVDSVVDTEIRRIQRGIRSERDVDTIESDAGFVDRACSEGMCFTEGKDLSLPAAGVAEAWNGLSALRRRFCAAVSLIRIVAVDRVVAAKPVVQVQRVLIVSHWSNPGPAKRVGTAVRQRYQREQLPY